MSAEGLIVLVTFVPPDDRRRDVDGMLASVKSYIDGIADVIKVDDSRWRFRISREAPRKPGLVRFDIEVAR